MNTETVIPLPKNRNTDLLPGDVVAFRFPHAHSATPGASEIGVVPCLVLGILDNEPDRLVELIGGLPLSAKIGTNFDIVVRSSRARAAAGIGSAMKFASSRRVIVSSRHPGFVRDPVTGSPGLGRLDPAGLGQLRRLTSGLDHVRESRHGRPSRVLPAAESRRGATE